MKSADRVAIIGFGEAGGIFAQDLAKRGIEVYVFDILFNSRRDQKRMQKKARAYRVTAAERLEHCLPQADLVISAVTASSALDVAKKAGPLLSEGQLFVDINSVSPDTKRKAAGYIEGKGARFVEAAVMAPVAPRRLQVPMLLGGPHASEATQYLQGIGMNAAPLSDQIGVASAVKMCRSVIIKGVEALAVESLFTARAYGAEKKVIESLAATYPQMGWQDTLPEYLISRVAEHGRRRAVEMREVAQTLRQAGIEPTMALATARCQEGLVAAMAKRRIAFKSDAFSWSALSDAMSRTRGRTNKSETTAGTESRPASMNRRKVR